MRCSSRVEIVAGIVLLPCSMWMVDSGVTPKAVRRLDAGRKETTVGYFIKRESAAIFPAVALMTTTQCLCHNKDIGDQTSRTSKTHRHVRFEASKTMG